MIDSRYFSTTVKQCICAPSSFADPHAIEYLSLFLPLERTQLRNHRRRGQHSEALEDRDAVQDRAQGGKDGRHAGRHRGKQWIVGCVIVVLL